jgi:tetratricopeptide (TPR) repeat protein
MYQVASPPFPVKRKKGIDQRTRGIPAMMISEKLSHDEIHTHGMRRSAHLILLIFIGIFFIAGCQAGAESAREMVIAGFNFKHAGQYEECINAMKRAVQAYPGDSWAAESLAYELSTLRYYEESVPAFIHALNISPQNSELWQGKGYALDNLGRYEEAIQAYDESIKYSNNETARILDDAWYLKGLSLQKLDRYPEAVQAFDQAIALDPKNTKVLNQKGVALMNMTWYGEAVQVFDQALKINPRYGEAQKNRKAAENQTGT